MGRFIAKIKLLANVMKRLDGSVPRECPACTFHGYFTADGMPPRFDVRCPSCGSLERHRLFVIGDGLLRLIKPDADVLHIAPEATLTRYIKSRCRRYVTLDLFMEHADIREPIEQTSIPDASFDNVVCSHVLEHVNDQRALRELNRILRPGGTALLMVPIVEGWDRTYENPAITSEFDREIHFGQRDHIRWYGRDFRTRVMNAGFELAEFTSDTENFIRYGLQRGEKVFVAKKPP